MFNRTIYLLLFFFKILRWWNDQGLAELLPFTRDRLSECLLWGLGYCCEPQHSLGIEGLTKVNQFISTIDDIYDIFGTIEELELFTHAIDRYCEY